MKSSATIAQLLMVEVKNREKLLSESWTDQLQYLNFMYKPDTRLKKITDQLIGMNYHEEEDAYTELIKLLESDQAEKHSHLIKYSIVSYSVNYLTGIIRGGQLHRGPELLDFYENSLEKGIFTINDKMPLQKFINVINIATKLGGPERSRKIIDKWAHKVDERNTKSIAKYGHATIDFKLEKYESVVQKLSQIKSSNLYTD